MNTDSISSQYRAALRMLRGAIEICPQPLWNRPRDDNPFWALAYHTVYFAHLYLKPENRFEPYERDVEGRAGFGSTDLGDWDKLTSEDVYSTEDVIAYLDHVFSLVHDAVLSSPFDGPSGFHWLPFDRGEAHLYNLRHIQHHVGGLAERLRQDVDDAPNWVGRESPGG